MLRSVTGEMLMRLADSMGYRTERRRVIAQQSPVAWHYEGYSRGTLTGLEGCSLGTQRVREGQSIRPYQPLREVVGGDSEQLFPAPHVRTAGSSAGMYAGHGCRAGPSSSAS